jgi:hypothetical protein
MSFDQAFFSTSSTKSIKPCPASKLHQINTKHSLSHPNLNYLSSSTSSSLNLHKNPPKHDNDRPVTHHVLFISCSRPFSPANFSIILIYHSPSTSINHSHCLHFLYLIIPLSHSPFRKQHLLPFSHTFEREINIKIYCLAGSPP